MNNGKEWGKVENFEKKTKNTRKFYLSYFMTLKLQKKTTVVIVIGFKSMYSVYIARRIVFQTTLDFRIRQGIKMFIILGILISTFESLWGFTFIAALIKFYLRCDDSSHHKFDTMLKLTLK